MTWKKGSWSIPLHLKPDPSVMTLATQTPQQKLEVLLPDVWCVHFYRYHGAVNLNGVPYPIHPGYVGIIPPNVRAVYRHDQTATHAYAQFRLPEEPGKSVTIPAMQDMEDDFAPLHTAFEEAIACFPRSPDRAGVRLWDILWRIAEGPISREQDLVREHPAISFLYTLIEERLCEPLRVSDLLAETKLSHSHLLRVFNEATGTSIQGYIQQRRLARAQHLLEETDLSIQEIAGAVGMPDRRVFNKMFHRAVGCAPREFRKRRNTDALQSTPPQRQWPQSAPVPSQGASPDSYPSANQF